MVYTIMILASRKPTITHSEFKTRYEQHMKLVAQLCGNAAPLKHTRRYPKHEGPDDKPILLAGNAETVPCHDVVVEMVFEDESAFGSLRFVVGELRSRVKKVRSAQARKGTEVCPPAEKELQDTVAVIDVAVDAARFDVSAKVKE
ncbi:hypothetical protein N0V88_007374 [Collariella sp. IMI 366227]|nr:hypothetical protein N0V88_007374 [Collariella sp. IMI 366227]